jgi:4-alpha-glucanotransferase
MQKPSPFSQRELGILLHPTSLYSHEDIGTLGKYAYEFLDWLEGARVTVWQILPLTRNGRYNSPYFSYSAFAGNPWLVDLDMLHGHGLLERPNLHPTLWDHRIPFGDLAKTKLPQLLTAADSFLGRKTHPWRQEYEEFVEAQGWLEDTAHFFALKDASGDRPWWEWDPAARTRRPEFLRKSKSSLADALQRYQAIFFFFDHQWRELKTYANQKGIRVLGDLPIYVDWDSADVWLHQKEFKLDATGHPKVVSGVPPDYFSEYGQLWGNPIYDWPRMEKDGFRWWMERLRRTLELSDVVRIDHFRALSAYWEIPTPAQDARQGKWVKGPGQKFFDVLLEHFPELPFVAEDLGTLDDDVYGLRDNNGLYGMRVLQFGFDGVPDNAHQPHQFPVRSIAYTGTHDNDTLAGWWRQLKAEERAEVARYYQFDPSDPIGKVVWSLIEAAIASRSEVAVIPLQDLLVLDQRARMNDPASFQANWEWRMPPDSLSKDLANSVRRLRDKYRRDPSVYPPSRFDSPEASQSGTSP